MQPTIVARVLTVVIALVCAIAGLALCAEGGFRLLRTYSTLDFSLSSIGIALALQVAGALLFAAAALTGLWSSAGLLSCLVLGLAAFAFAAMPNVAIALFTSIEGLPLPWFSILFQGLPQFVLLTLGAAGVAMKLQRSVGKPRKGSGTAVGHVVGLLGSPLLIIGGLLVAARGIEANYALVSRFGDGPADPRSVFLIVIGGVMLFGGVLFARWSPHGLLLPALALLVAAVISFTPALAPVVLPIMLIPPVLLNGIALTGTLVGATIAAAAVRAKSRRVARHAS
ncbi:MAG TPA: hypothetical protein H9830_02815 [Candidatus Agrococcus pullicola]|uniref:Uncharacterized protein n=1 Tax=Candidatus Agrococcus pullicola TaxID=2838429 RepID=A0A9D2C8F4_9MICO|nr:hypothetical protein [Candidatus Agrococcus pullicola]